MSKVYILKRTANPPELATVQKQFTDNNHTIETALSMADWVVMLSSCEQEMDKNIIHHCNKHNVMLDIVGYKPNISMLYAHKNVTFYVSYDNFVHRNFLVG